MCKVTLFQVLLAHAKRCVAQGALNFTLKFCQASCLLGGLGRRSNWVNNEDSFVIKCKNHAELWTNCRIFPNRSS